MVVKTIQNVFLFSYILFPVILPKFDTFFLGKKGNYAVLRGTTLRMNCIPMDEQRNEQRDLEMIWTDEEGRELVESRITKMENGDLEIVNAHVGDSGIYKCKVRPPASSKSTGEVKIYEHKLIVYELSGHKFVSTVSFDMSKYSTEVMITMLKDLLSITVCSHNLCIPGTIKSSKCETWGNEKKQMCEFSMVYEAINQIADDKCDEECVREKMFESLKKAERILEGELLRMSEDRKGRLKADMKTFDTKHLITCRAGFHLVKAHYKRCFPCLPGSYSQPNSVECSLCNIGYYQEHFGKRECDKCEEGKTTDTMGAKSRDECTVQESPGILSNIREGIASIFSG